MQPALVGAGPAFALVVPMIYTIETQPPENSPHLSADHHDPIVVGTEVMLLLVFVLVAGRTVLAQWARVVA